MTQIRDDLVFWDFRGEEMVDEIEALRELLGHESLLFVGDSRSALVEDDASAGNPLGVYLNCNDVFAWGCADEEPLRQADLGPLVKVMRADPKWGGIKYACRLRKQRPQKPIIRDMKADGAWDEDMEALP